MDYHTMLAMVITEYCVTTTILIMLITIAWLIKQVELLFKIVHVKPIMRDASTQTWWEKQYFTSSQDNDNETIVKKRRSHRGGQQNYLRKWPGSYPQ